MIPRPPLHYPDQPVHAFLQQAADLDGERTALHFDGSSFTYRELDGAANAFTRALTRLGFSMGDRAAMVVTNRPEYLIAEHGVMQAGGSVVMPSPAWKELELRNAFELTSPAAVIADAALVPLVESVGAPALRICVDDPAPPGWLSFWQLLSEESGRRPAELDADLTTLEVALPFSSGTTGLPKAVRYTHGSLIPGILNWNSAMRIQREDRLQFFMPLFHIYGIVVTGCALVARAPLTLFPRFDVDRMLQNIQDEAITVAFAATPIATALANHPDLEAYDLSSLRYVLWAATPISPEVAERVSARTGIRWLGAYGTTEVPGLHCNPVDQPDRWRLDSPGLPVSDLEVRVVTLGTDDDVPAGEEGEIVVRGPHSMAGYLPEEANVDAFLPGGWFRTGDVGWVEPEGWIHITDRAKEMLKVSGFTVSPLEIENVLLSHPAVADCAVYGVAHPTKGEAPKAAVLVRVGAEVSADELKAWVAGLLAGYKHLVEVAFVEEIPRTGSGKVLRRTLKEADAASA